MARFSIPKRKEVSKCWWRAREELCCWHGASPLHRVVCWYFWWDEVRNCSPLWLLRYIQSWACCQSSRLKVLISSRAEHSVFLGDSYLVTVRVWLSPLVGCLQLFCCISGPESGLLHEPSSTWRLCPRLRSPPFSASPALLHFINVSELLPSLQQRIQIHCRLFCLRPLQRRIGGLLALAICRLKLIKLLLLHLRVEDTSALVVGLNRSRRRLQDSFCSWRSITYYGCEVINGFVYLIRLSSSNIHQLRLSFDLIILHRAQLLLQFQIFSYLLTIRQKILIFILRYICRLWRILMYKWDKKAHL